MHTADQAIKELICPIVSDGNEEIGCQGDRCMAWRWGEEEDAHPDVRRLGYCGLVGKPEYLA